MAEEMIPRVIIACIIGLGLDGFGDTDTLWGLVIGRFVSLCP